MDKEHSCNNKCIACKLFDNKSALNVINIQYFINSKDYELGKVIYISLDICGCVIIKIMIFVLKRMLENVLMNYNKLTKKKLSMDKTLGSTMHS